MLRPAGASARHPPPGRPENTQTALRALRAMRLAPHPDGHRFRELRWFGPVGRKPGITAQQARCDFALTKAGQTVHVLLDGLGGSFAEAREIAELAERHSGRVRVAVRSECRGAALLLLMAADERYCRPDATFHLCPADPPATGDRCTAEVLRHLARLTEMQNKSMARMLASRCGVSSERMLRLLDTGRVIGADEALKIGLIDRIASPWR